MWGVVIGLLLVSAAIAEDAVNATSDSSEEVKEAEKVENTLNESRRFSKDDINANTALRSLQISNPINNLIPNQQQHNHAAVSLPDQNVYSSLPSSPLINGQVNNVPLNNILQKQSGFYSTIPNLNVPTIKDSNLYYYSPLSRPQINGQVNNVPPSNILQKPSVFYPTIPNLNVPTIKDSSLHYVTPLVTQNHENGIYPPPPRNILQQNILNQPGSTQESSCNGHSEVLYRVWLILRTLLESGPRSPYINQIQHALILLTNYLKELNPGNLNSEFITSLEKELDKKRINSQLPTTWNINPGLGVDVPPSNLGRAGNISPNCKKSLLKLIELTQAAFAFILNSPNCQENHIEQSSNSHPYQIPYFNQNVYNTGTYPLNQLLGTYPSHVLNQKPIGTPDLNSLMSSPINPSIVGTPSQLQHNPLNEFMNSNFVDVQSSPYSPYGYSFHSSVKSGSQLKNPEISIPTQPLGLWYNSQNQQPLSSIPLKRDNSLSSQVPNNPLIGGFPNGYTNHFQNNLGPRTVPNNFHQQINLNTPPGSLITPPNSSPIDQHALWSSLQNMPSNPAYRQNIQNYLNSQTVQHHNYQVPPQSGPYNNVNPPVNNNIPPQTHVSNNGFVSNVQPGSLPSQHHGSYRQFYSQSTPYTNNPHLPILHNFTGHNMYGFNQGIGSTRTQTSAIDWYNILNGSNLGPNNTPNGEVELTFAIRRTDQNQPLYFVKYRIAYDVFIQNIRGLLSRRSGDSDIAKGLVVSSNASEVPKELASVRKEELTQIVVKEGVLTNARYIDDSDNTSSSAANSINALLDNTINKNVDNITAKDDFTRSQLDVSNSR